MPIRSPHGRSAAYRSIWAWPLRSPLRLAVTTGVLVALAVATTVVVTFIGGGRAAVPLLGTPVGSAPAGSASARPGVPASPTPTMLPPVPELTPTPLPLSRAPREAVDVAARWAAAWVRPHNPNTTPQHWLDGLRPTTTDEYLGVLSGVDPHNIPATKVTGPPRPVRAAARSVQVEVPTDAVTLVVLVVRTEDGWRVAGYDRS